eukprot:1557782-Rhodomonas_salina.3
MHTFRNSYCQCAQTSVTDGRTCLSVLRQVSQVSQMVCIPERKAYAQSRSAVLDFLSEYSSNVTRPTTSSSSTRTRLAELS